MMAHCQIIFDVSGAPFRGWPFVGIGSLLALGGLGIAFANRKDAFGKRWGFLITVVVFTTAVSAYCVSDYLGARRAIAAGDFAVVDGVIDQYFALPERAHGLEGFIVNGRRFEFSGQSVTSGFAATRRAGGTLAVGTPVRIAYRDNQILRVEICERETSP
jgi:hypothetical protein